MPHQLDLDRLFDSASPIDFIRGDAVKVLGHFANEPDAPRPLSFNTLFGRESPALRDFFECLRSQGCLRDLYYHDFSKAQFSGLGQGGANSMLWLLDYEGANCYESLAQAFCGTFNLGYDPNGESWYTGLFDVLEDGSQAHFVYAWEHDGDGFDPLFASLDDLTWSVCTHLLGAEAQERARARRPGTLPKRETYTQFAHWRANWLIHLMDQNFSGARLKYMDMDLPNVFCATRNIAIDATRHQQQLERGVNHLPTAIYMLWRYFWFDHEDRLREALAVYKDAPAQLTRDAAVLIQELLDGRNTLPGIDDVRDQRARVLTLNLDPDRT